MPKAVQTGVYRGIEEAEEQALLLAEPELPHQLTVSQGTNPKKRFYSASELG